jgi:ribosomal protein S18 acetylase RimI-like enzyme
VTTIRPATPADVPKLADVGQRSWSDAFGWSVSPEDLAAELESRSEASFAQALSRWTTLVAEDDGTLAGYVQFGDVAIEGIDPQPADQELHQLYVDPPLQGAGIGRALMEAALAHPRLAQAKRVYLQVWERNERAVRLYERLGFRVVGTTSFTVGSEDVEDLVMALDVSPSRG